MARNALMAERIERATARDPLSFVVAGDTGAWPDPTADAIFAQLLRQAARVEPAPVLFANLGDFAGPGTPERHRRYLDLVAGLPVPDVCIVGNHDLDDPAAAATWAQVHGARNFSFAHGRTRFVALDAAPFETPHGTTGPGDEALAFLDHALGHAAEPQRVVLMHAPPHAGGRFHPHEQWGFDVRERDFLGLLRRHGVRLVCCAHALTFDTFVLDGTRFVVSGGGGTALCSHLRGVCAPGAGPPEDRGALFHAVHITIAADGAVSGRVLQAFEPVDGHARLRFEDA